MKSNSSLFSRNDPVGKCVAATPRRLKVAATPSSPDSTQRTIRCGTKTRRGRRVHFVATGRRRYFGGDLTESFRLGRSPLPLALVLAILNLAMSSLGADGEAAARNAGESVPLTLKLPAPAFVGTPKDAPTGTNIEPPSNKPRPPLMVPKDTQNVAPHSRITSSDPNATADALAKVTDGDKEALDSSVVLLRKGTQYLQFDLSATHEVFAIVIWHAHDTPKVYRDVIVQVSDDAGFTNGVQTLFNNDKDNSSGRGAGDDREYFETNQGKLIDAKGVKARYVRMYSRGSTESALNEYTEVEIYARQVK